MFTEEAMTFVANILRFLSSSALSWILLISEPYETSVDERPPVAPGVLLDQAPGGRKTSHDSSGGCWKR